MEPIKSKQTYENIVFQDASTESAYTTQSDFEDCTFKSCNFNAKSFGDCLFAKCTFENCDIGAVKLPNSKFDECRFVNCRLSGVNWSTLRDELGTKLACESCDLSYSVFSGQNLNFSSFSDCRLNQSNFEKVDFRGVSLKAATLSKLPSGAAT